VTYFQNFGTPPYLGNGGAKPSNSTCKFNTRGTNRKYKIRSKGSQSGHVTHFSNFGTTSVSRERLEL